MFGKTPGIFTSDLIVPFVTSAWYLVHYTPFGKLLQKKLFKYPIMVRVGTFRG